MKNKKEFIAPEAEIINFANEDIILTSDVGGQNIGNIPEYDPNPGNGWW